MKEIKKAIVYIIIGASLLFLVVGTVGAQTYATYKTKQNYSFERLTNELIDLNNVIVYKSNELIDLNNVIVYKFVDGNVTCYGSYAVTTNNKQATNASLTCLK